MNSHLPLQAGKSYRARDGRRVTFGPQAHEVDGFIQAMNGDWFERATGFYSSLGAVYEFSYRTIAGLQYDSDTHEQETGIPANTVAHYSVIEMGRACAEETCVSAAEVQRLIRNGRKYEKLAKCVLAHKEAVVSASRSAVRVCDYDRELWSVVE